MDIINNSYDDVDLDSLLESIEEAVIISCEEAINKLGLSAGILDYLVSEGILIGDLVEAQINEREAVNVQRTEEADSKKNNNDMIIKLYEEGKSMVEIAKELNLGVGEVTLVIDLYER